MSKEESKAASGLSAKVDKKRKRQVEDGDAGPSNGSTTATATTTTPVAAADGPSKKKQKNKQKLKEKKKLQKAKEQEQQGDGEGGKGGQRKEGIDEAIGKMDGRLLVDHFAQKAKRHNKELTAMELNDLSVPGECHRTVAWRFALRREVWMNYWLTDEFTCRFCVPRYIVVRVITTARLSP